MRDECKADEKRHRKHPRIPHVAAAHQYHVDVDDVELERAGIKKDETLKRKTDWEGSAHGPAEGVLKTCTGGPGARVAGASS